MRDALTRADQTGAPFDLCSACFFVGLIELFCGNATDAHSHATRVAEVSADKGIAFFAPVGRFLCGAALAQVGEVDRGLTEMQQGLAEQQAVTGWFFCDLMLGFMAAAHGAAEQWAEGLRCADEGIALTETMLERIYAAELWRIKGELLVGQAQTSKTRTRPLPDDVTTAARQCFRRAVEIAHAQGARSLTLRSATSLVRLSLGSATDEEARALLRATYTSFTEGFDTRDLRDARALLAEIGSPRDPAAPID